MSPWSYDPQFPSMTISFYCSMSIKCIQLCKLKMNMQDHLALWPWHTTLPLTNQPCNWTMTPLWTTTYTLCLKSCYRWIVWEFEKKHGVSASAWHTGPWPSNWTAIQSRSTVKSTDTGIHTKWHTHCWHSDECNHESVKQSSRSQFVWCEHFLNLFQL